MLGKRGTFTLSCFLLEKVNMYLIFTISPAFNRIVSRISTNAAECCILSGTIKDLVCTALFSLN